MIKPEKKLPESAPATKFPPEERHNIDGEPVETGIELESICDVPFLKIKNLNVKNIHITIYQPGCFGGAGENE